MPCRLHDHDDESVVVVLNEDNETTPLLATVATEEYSIDDALSHIGYGRMRRLLLTRPWKLLRCLCSDSLSHALPRP